MSDPEFKVPADWFRQSIGLPETESYALLTDEELLDLVQGGHSAARMVFFAALGCLAGSMTAVGFALPSIAAGAPIGTVDGLTMAIAGLSIGIMAFTFRPTWKQAAAQRTRVRQIKSRVITVKLNWG